jgi:phosphoglycolate phosphatase
MSDRRTAAAVLFDLDGTLIDSAPDLGAAADKMRTDRGLAPLGLDVYRPMAGAGARGMLGIAFGMAPDHADYEAHRDEFLHNYEQGMTERTHAFEGVAELLEALQARGVPWGIVTNKMERFTLPLVRLLPVLSGARVVVGGDTTPHPKPHPAPLLEAARRLALDPAQCVYVGDDERDIVAGRAAGMRTVAACYGYLGAQTDIQVWQADHVVKDPLGVLKCLELP